MTKIILIHDINQCLNISRYLNDDPTLALSKDETYLASI